MLVVSAVLSSLVFFVLVLVGIFGLVCVLLLSATISVSLLVFVFASRLLASIALVRCVVILLLNAMLAFLDVDRVVVL